MAKSTGSVSRSKSNCVGISAKARIRKSGARPLNTSTAMRDHLALLVQDLSTDDVTPERGNAVCNVVGKLLGLVKMEYEYGTPRKMGVAPRPAQFQLGTGGKA